jgi:antirestriction protein ArdC
VNPPNSQNRNDCPMRDYREEVTDSVIRMLEEGVAPWQKPWKGLEIPMNPTTDNAYRGGNAVHLMATALQRGFDDPRWMTYKQAAENGWQVKRGEKGTQIEFWEVKDHSDKQKDDPSQNENSDRPERRLVHRIYTVFNAKQVEGIPPYAPKERTPFEAVEAGERILKNSSATLRHDQADRCFYNRRTDSIHLTPKDTFRDAAGYYGTALHELSHWSGHPSRLNRATLNDSYRFGDPAYAREELRAELASLFIAAETSIPHDPASHAAYVGSWVDALRKDKNEIFRAAHDASAAADFVLSLDREKSIAEQELASEPATMTQEAAQLTAVELESETDNLRRVENAAIDNAVENVADQAASGNDAAPPYKPGDKIVAFEPYHYGGKPKKEPETPGIVQSVYADGRYVSYMRLDGNGNLRENGNKPVDDRGLRLADETDLEQFGKQFAQLETAFGETSRHSAQYEPISGTVNVHDKQTATDHRSTVDDSTAKTPSAKPAQSLRNSFSDAQSLTKETVGKKAKTYVAQTESGVYRGEIIGQTDLHVIQRLSGESAVAHMKHLLSRTPEPGRNVLIAYSKDGGRVKDLQEKSRSQELSR